MNRLEIIDGLRGYFLVFMMINHLNFTGGFQLVKLNHNQLAFVEDAQGFIFLSGLLVGLVYARKMQRGGFAAGAKAIWRRARQLYVYVLLALAALLVATAVLPGAAELWRPWIGDLSLTNPVRVVSALLMVFQPTYMDILPQYIFYMLFAPFALWLCLNGRWGVVAVVSLLLWMVAQLGLQKPFTEPLNSALAGDGPIGIRAHFNLLAWQIVFFSGVVLGALTSQNAINWGKVFSPRHSIIPLAALAICLFFLPLRVATGYGLMPDDMLQRFMPFEVRASFGLVYLLNFVAAASGVAWLLIAGPKHHYAYVRTLANGLIWLLKWPFLRLLGRHSLQVYAWHIVIVYAVIYIDLTTPEFSELTKSAMAILGISLMAIPALWRERGHSDQPPGHLSSR
ncbi:hypothetical protein FPY71_12250 [Aureimonas fodinaquatilis]|uniref:DUF1624 domain-containing protein n=1 Tax=Aureimonas fodinaquatilis TaxID=2565783 RepID=A0A5B0DRA6_9HYPH|nr:OpgC domain-containing protein [Aureimonas fodinaquatilis]KAA0969324.1 hypothetical protein FPY71_12250 [Aureimonas fodinaquatilis]